ncbi:hypothetical protein IFM89_035148 [Coptis chinensis]|uniref:Uncharacterized protein n=1 Tax=Coptis chinensis TaxID=261450 RepID=A0A835M879_9MAGN|nr:hypothetical protein IFM89_035148 [Coptis chinensis]
MDRNDYYGGESSSLNLVQLWKRFRGDNKPPEQLGSSKEYNVDMIPKLMVVLFTTKARALKGIIPRDLVDKLSTLRSQISLLAEDTGGSAYTQLNGALERYLPVVLGLTKKEANSLLLPNNPMDASKRTVSEDSKKDAIDLLIKAVGYLEFYFRDILICLPPDIKNKLPKDCQEGVLEALSIQALGESL